MFIIVLLKTLKLFQMKILKFFKIALLTGVLAFNLSLMSYAQGGPPPPPGGGGGGSDDNQNPGGSAPVGSGLLLLLSLGAAYSANKLIHLKNSDED